MAIFATLLGLLVGTLNSDPVHLDLLWTQFTLPLGLAILLGFSLGVVMGLSILYIYRVLPLRLQLRNARAAITKHHASDSSLPDD